MTLFAKSKIAEVKAALENAKNIAIITHFNPDGDAVGSSLALYQYFSAEGYNVTPIFPNPISHFLRWIPGMKDAIIAEHFPVSAQKALQEADILFVVDMNGAHRSGVALEPHIANSPAFKILIDHHLCPDIDCNVMFSSTETTSTCELVYRFLEKMMDTPQKITKDLATCIYVGMITDTGSLSYMCNQPRTYLIISELMKRGIDGENIHRRIYDNYEESRIKLLGLCLSQRLTIKRDLSTTYMYLTKKDLTENGYKVGDTEGIVNYGLSLKGIQFTAFFTERDDRIRVSFRSKGNFDTNLFARQHFNGGGHKNASAAFCYETMENAIRHFEEVLENYREVLNPKNFEF